MNLYDVLGVSRDATEDEIKKAARKKKMDTHPDRGGNAKDFDTVQKAADVLLDPERRKNYDEHGDTEPQLDFETQAKNALAQLICEIVELRINNAIRENVISIARENIVELLNKTHIHATMHEHGIRKRETVLSRLKHRKGGQNLLADALMADLRNQKMLLQNRKNFIKQMNLMLEMLGAYEYETTEPPVTVRPPRRLPAGGSR